MIAGRRQTFETPKGSNKVSIYINIDRGLGSWRRMSAHAREIAPAKLILKSQIKSSIKAL